MQLFSQLDSHTETLMAREDIAEGTLLLEVRGSLIKEQKVVDLIKDSAVREEELPTLLKFNSTLLIFPKNVSKWLFTGQSGPECNCCIARDEHSCKMFIKTLRQVKAN